MNEHTRLLLAEWCKLHQIEVPIGAVVEAFCLVMKDYNYGLEETWDAFCWFREGFFYKPPMETTSCQICSGINGHHDERCTANGRK